eukprot:TRINITY_DN4467_c0_g1_i3.p1 TRINITY_DN4467_c0_g1~~TRINITY_DN4467_c0_g1_i3.p1  ORF type:complete len:508 (+),score=167.36 TRINITY_DN4467_c0_g1_i3:390-1913(+)
MINNVALSAINRALHKDYTDREQEKDMFVSQSTSGSRRGSANVSARGSKRTSPTFQSSANEHFMDIIDSDSGDGPLVVVEQLYDEGEVLVISDDLTNWQQDEDAVREFNRQFEGNETIRKLSEEEIERRRSSGEKDLDETAIMMDMWRQSEAHAQQSLSAPSSLPPAARRSFLKSIGVNLTDAMHTLIDLLKMTPQLIECQRTCIFLHDEATDELCTLYSFHDQIIQLAVPVDTGLVGSVFTSHQVLVIDHDAHTHPSFFKDIDQMVADNRTLDSVLCVPVIDHDAHTHPSFFKDIDQMVADNRTLDSVLCVPLKAEGVVYGVIECVNKQRGGFTEKNIDHVKMIADLATLKLQRHPNSNDTNPEMAIETSEDTYSLSDTVSYDGFSEISNHDTITGKTQELLEMDEDQMSERIKILLDGHTDDNSEDNGEKKKTTTTKRSRGTAELNHDKLVEDALEALKRLSDPYEEADPYCEEVLRESKRRRNMDGDVHPIFHFSRKNSDESQE